MGLINSLRFHLRAWVTRLLIHRRSVHKVIESALPESVVQMIAPRCKRSRNFPFGSRLLDGRFNFGSHQVSETSWLEHNPGVGPITALYFVLNLEIRHALNECLHRIMSAQDERGETIRSCASANVVTPTCDGSWLARLSIF